MPLISRREAGKLMAAGSAGLLAGVVVSRGRLRGAQMIDSVVRGVEIGAQSYSFRDRPLAAAIEAYRTVGLGECELYEGHVAPDEQKTKREERRQWRLTTPLSHFHEIRRQFRKDFTESEIERGFQMAQALGVKYITASSNVSVAPRVDAYARKYQIMVGFHGHDDTANPDEFSTAETFARAMQGASRYLGVNLDIGHFTAAGGDPVEYIRQHHDRIVTLHVKDRKKNHGPNMPFGQGDTPIVAVLRLLREERWKIPANIEYEYGKPGMDTIAEVKKCYEYCRKALES